MKKRLEAIFRKTLIATGILTLLFFGTVIASLVLRPVETPASNNQQVPVVATPPSADELFVMTNQQRTANGIPAVSQEQKLNMSAQQKAEDMKKRNYYSHTDPEGKKGHLIIWDFVPKHETQYVSENLANFCSGEGSTTVIQKWLNSPSHKAAMLDPRYDRVGFGVVLDEASTCKGYVVLHLIDNAPPQPQVYYRESPRRVTACTTNYYPHPNNAYTSCY